MQIADSRRLIVIFALVLVTSALAMTLGVMTRTHYVITGDCMPPPGYTGGGYRCDTPITAHPFIPMAISIAVIGLGAAIWLGLQMRPPKRFDTSLV
jgi:hypothetical protein